jgi:hypothetical protein
MNVTDQELRAVAFVVARCRPHGARQWDEAGIYAKIAEVRDRSLGSIIIAAVQAAEDRAALTPGVIPTPGPHWRTPDAAPVTTADKVEPSAHCAGCGKPKGICETRRAVQRGMDRDDPRYDDHEYTPVGAARGHKRPPEVAAEIHQALAADIQPMREPTRRDDRPTVPNPAADAARAALKENPCADR